MLHWCLKIIYLNISKTAPVLGLAVKSFTVKKPNCTTVIRLTDLLADVLAFRGEQVDEVRDSAGVDDDAGLLGGAGSNVSQSPGRLELKDRVRQERDQPKR